MNTGLARRRKPRRLKSEINVVPYIDVMLVLLVIFMVTAPLLTLNFEVELPASNAPQLQSKQNPIVISVLADGRLSLTLPEDNNPQFMDESTLENYLVALAAQNPDLQPLVAADRNAAYQSVIKATDVLRRAGIKKVGLPAMSGN